MKQLNPLYVAHQSLVPECVLMVRVLALFLLITNSWFRGVFLDFTGLNLWDEITLVLNSAYAVQYIAVCTGTFLLLFSGWVRAGALIVGAAIVYANLRCPECISVAHLFTACVFLTASLSNLTTSHTLIRYQLAVLYLCADANKLIDADWWTGRTMETMLIINHQVGIYKDLASLLPPFLLSQVVGISVMVMQLLIVIFLVFSGTPRLAAGIAILLHIPMILLTDTTFGPFLVALIVSFGAILGWRRSLYLPRGFPEVPVGILRFFDANGQVKEAGKEPGNTGVLRAPSQLKDWLSYPPFLYAGALLVTGLILFNHLAVMSVLVGLVFLWSEFPALTEELGRLTFRRDRLKGSGMERAGSG